MTQQPKQIPWDKLADAGAILVIATDNHRVTKIMIVVDPPKQQRTDAA